MSTKWGCDPKINIKFNLLEACHIFFTYMLHSHLQCMQVLVNTEPSACHPGSRVPTDVLWRYSQTFQGNFSLTFPDRVTNISI